MLKNQKQNKHNEDLEELMDTQINLSNNYFVSTI
jgi:hypothetical protein